MAVVAHRLVLILQEVVVVQFVLFGLETHAHSHQPVQVHLNFLLKIK
jgi:hypothetical protein